MKRVAAIIPCRMGSTRLPGKPLADICGRPMIEWVYRAVVASACFDAGVWVASADGEVIAAASHFGAPTVRTSGRHLTGTDCMAEAAAALEAELIVNVQGDEPMIEAGVIRSLVEGATKSSAEFLGAYAPLNDLNDALDKNRVKVALSRNGDAVMLSRFPIPYPQEARPDHYLQLGLSAFTPSALGRFAARSSGPLEDAEGIELLRVLEYDERLAMVELHSRSIPVDTLADLARVRAIMSERE